MHITPLLSTHYSTTTLISTLYLHYYQHNIARLLTHSSTHHSTLCTYYIATIYTIALLSKHYDTVLLCTLYNTTIYILLALLSARCSAIAPLVIWCLQWCYNVYRVVLECASTHYSTGICTLSH